MILKLLIFAAILPLQTASNPSYDKEDPSVDTEGFQRYLIFSEQLRNANCTDHGEGGFVLGCSSEIYFCSIHVDGFLKTVQHCPKWHGRRLKMNPDENRCEEERNIALCQPGADNGYATAIKLHDHFSCKDKENGYYATHRCSQEYAQCDNGTIKALLCDSFLLFFNRKTGICEHRIFGNCNRGRKSLSSVKLAPHEVFQPIPSGTNCPEHEGVLFNGRRCVSMMWRCENGYVVTFNCPRGLFFSETLQLCTHKSEVPECNLNSFVVAIGRQFVCSVALHSASNSERRVPDNFTVNCTERGTGFHEISECNRDYLQCSNRHSLIISCPEELFFNSDTETCVNKCDVNRGLGTDLNTHGQLLVIYGEIFNSCLINKMHWKMGILAFAIFVTAAGLLYLLQKIRKVHRFGDLAVKFNNKHVVIEKFPNPNCQL